MNWDNIQNYVQLSTAIISIVLNTILIFLILKKSPKRLGAYKHLMLLISIFEIFYSVMDVLVSPVFHSQGLSNMIYVNVKKSIFNRKVALIMIGIYSGCFGFSLAVFAIHFVYRYFVVSGNKLLKNYKKRSIIIWMVVPIIYGIVWGSTCYYLCGPNEKMNKHFENNLLENFDIKIDHITYIGFSFYSKDEDGNSYISYKTTIILMIFFFELVSSLSVIFYFGIKCHTRIHKLIRESKMSAKNTGLQSQLFYALVTQAFIPAILMHFPFTSLLFLEFLGIDIGKTGGLLSLTIALYPAFDPIPTMLMIENYRDALFGFLRMFGRKQNSHTASNNNAYHSPL